PQLLHVEAEQARGVLAEDLRPLGVVEAAHLPLDRLGGVRPRALVVRVVVRPEKAVDEAMLAGEREAGVVLLERGEAVRAELLARKRLQLRAYPHVVLLVGLVHRLERPRDPADPGLDGREAELREALEHTRGAEVRDRL